MSLFQQNQWILWLLFRAHLHRKDYHQTAQKCHPKNRQKTPPQKNSQKMFRREYLQGSFHLESHIDRSTRFHILSTGSLVQR